MRVGIRLLLLALLPLAGSTPAMAQPPLKYVSYNILHGGALSGLSGDAQDLDRRLELAVQELRLLDPDIIGLQEASVNRWRGNVAARLADALGFHYVRGTALFRLFPFEWFNGFVAWLMNLSEGPAIVSRFPIIDWEQYDLPRCNGWYDPRVLLYATLETPWGRVTVASTHTTRGFCEAPRVIDILQARRGLLPTVLMGDFNATEGSTAISALIERAGFVDTFRAANPGDPGPTVWQRVYASTPTVSRRVDFVFMMPGSEVPGRVLASRVVLNSPGRLDDGRVLWPSDHYGVFTELEVFPGSAGRDGSYSRPG
jgi:endonuclease/exonuclease/phosphatase family metal-dependent hydrolase